MFPNSCNIQETGAPQFGCMQSQMQAQSQPNMIRCQSQTPRFCQPHGSGCDCRTVPGSNYMQPSGMNSPMMNGGQGMMSPNCIMSTQNQNQQQQQRRMMQQMYSMQQQYPQQGGNQIGQNVCPNMQRNMNQNAMPHQQQPYNMNLNSY